MKYSKTTEFIGRSSGDCECFCFDKRDQKEQQVDEEISLTGSLDEQNWRTSYEKERNSRLYPDDLLPLPYNHPDEKKMGKWKITVEFEPFQEGENHE